MIVSIIEKICYVVLVIVVVNLVWKQSRPIDNIAKGLKVIAVLMFILATLKLLTITNIV